MWKAGVKKTSVISNLAIENSSFVTDLGGTEVGPSNYPIDRFNSLKRVVHLWSETYQRSKNSIMSYFYLVQSELRSKHALTTVNFSSYSNVFISCKNPKLIAITTLLTFLSHGFNFVIIQNSPKLMLIFHRCMHA